MGNALIDPTTRSYVVSSTGGFEEATEAQNAIYIALAVHQGSLPGALEIGSKLYTLQKATVSGAQIRDMADQALAPLVTDGVIESFELLVDLDRSAGRAHVFINYTVGQARHSFTYFVRVL